MNKLVTLRDDFKKGDAVILHARKDFKAIVYLQTYVSEDGQTAHLKTLGASVYHYQKNVQKVPLHMIQDYNGAVDVEGTPVNVGDEICRLNTTDNIQNLERRKVIGVSNMGIMMAPKNEGGRTTSSSDFEKVMLISKKAS